MKIYQVMEIGVNDNNYEEERVLETFPTPEKAEAYRQKESDRRCKIIGEYATPLDNYTVEVREVEVK